MMVKLSDNIKKEDRIQIVYVPIGDLKPAEYNPRKADEKQHANLKASIEKFGLKDPIIVNSAPKRKNVIIGGHFRVRVANDMGIKDVPVVYVNIPDLEREKELNVRLNRNTGEFDLDLLANFDQDMLKDIGFDSAELDKIFKLSSDDKDDDVPEVPKVAKTKRGDIYQIGRHRLMCGDSTSESDVALLMDNKKADMVFTDPPYNVNYSNFSRPKPSKKDLGKIKNDFMEVSQFKEFISNVLNNCFISTREDSSIYLWYASASATAILMAFDESGWKRIQEIIWKKPMLLGRGKYQWAHEPCIFAIKGKPFFTTDRTKTTVWDFGGYDKSKNVHPTQKPIVLCSEGILNSARNGDIVLDLFLGSGSTLIACEKTNRICYGMEIDPKYCDVIVDRWEKYTGKKAELINGKARPKA